MNHTPLVSVIIPTYNRANCVGRAIESIQNQIYKNYEIIVVDDGSTDNTKDIVSAYYGITYIYKKNGRQASARNAGLLVAKGEYIATLDSDDIWHENFLSESLGQLIEFDLDLVFSNTFRRNKLGENIDKFMNWKFMYPYYYTGKHQNKTWIHLEYKEVRHLFTITCPAPSSALVFKRASILRNWDELINVGDDWDFVLGILLSKTCKTAFCKEPLWTKNIIGDNIYESIQHENYINSFLLYDVNRIVEKNKGKFTSFELSSLRRYQVVGVLDIALQKILYGNTKGVNKLIILAFKTSPFQTIKFLITADFFKNGRKIWWGFKAKVKKKLRKL